MAFYVLDPDDGEVLPKGKIIRFKTLSEVRKHMRDRPRALRIYFHDLGTLLDLKDSIDVEDLPRVEPPSCRGRDGR